MHGRGNCTPGAEPGQWISPLHEAKGQTRVENPLVRGGGEQNESGRASKKKDTLYLPYWRRPKIILDSMKLD